MQLIILNIFILPLFHHLYHLTDDHVAHRFERLDFVIYLLILLQVYLVLCYLLQ